MFGLEELLERYAEATGEALEAVRQGKMEQLNQCLDRRDQLIKQIVEMCRQTGERFISDKVSEPVQKRIGQIKEMDRELISAMTDVRDAIGEKIGSIQKGKHLRNQYSANYTIADGVFFDKRK